MTAQQRDPRETEHRLIRRRRNPWRTLHLEQLESRYLLSVTPTLSYNQVTPDWFSALGTGTSNATGRWIVRLTPEVVASAPNVAAAAELLHANTLPIEVVRGLGLPGQLLVDSTAGKSRVDAALAASPLIASFQFDTTLSGSQLPNDPTFANGGDSYLDQYALFNIGQDSGTAGADIDADLAWNITHGSSSVVIAVIDSGIDYVHPDLAANIWANPGEIAGNGIDDDGNGYIDDVRGYDFHNRDNNPLDDQGHGTHVAGIIGAVGNNSLGVTGINWATSLLPVKFLDQNNVGSVAHAVEAINYVTMLRTRTVNPVNVRVINASWGGSGVDDSQLKAAIQAAGAAGILFVTSAGNGDVFGRGQNIDQLPFFPASFDLDNTVVVAATDRNDQLTTFSNYGTSTVDVAAPGLSILSSNLFIDGSTTIEDYQTRSGTSMAAPLVTGTAALLWATAPNATVAEVRDAILHGADTLASLNGKIAGGRRLNAYGALVALPPQATAGSLSNINLPGVTPYQFTVTLASNTILQDATIGTGDFVVRRQGGGSDLVASFVSKSSSNGDKTWTVTYSVLPADGNWDVFDTGTYQIEMVAGQVLDLNNVPSRQKVIGTFAVDFSALGVFRPDVFADGADANPGDGLAKTAGNVTTLRAAIQEANLVNLGVVPTGGTVILKPGTYSLTLGGAGEDAAATGDLDITGKVTIASDGTGSVTINANGIDRVFDVLAGGNLSLQGVMITGGYAVAEDGGGIRNNGTLTVTTSTIENNTTTLNGGGIYNAAGKSATVTASNITNNTAAGSSTQVLQLDGAPTQVNTTTAGGQYDPNISVNASGQAIVTWTNNADGITVNGANTDVYGQRLNADGTKNGSQFQLNSAFSSAVQNADVVLENDGNIGASYEVDYGGADAFDVAFSSFNNSGLVSAGTIRQTGVNHDQFRTQITQTADGNYLIVWTDDGPLGSGLGAFARTVDRNGVSGPAVAVPTTTAGDQAPTGMARMPSGEIMVVFHDSGLDGSGWGVYGRMLDSAGAPIGTQFPLATTTVGNQWYPHVTASSSGFVVTWYSDSGGFMRLFNSAGIAVSAEIPITALTATDVTAARLSDGSIIAVWIEFAGAGYTTQGSPVNKLWMRRYDTTGTPMAAAQLLTSTGRFVFGTPKIEADNSGNAYIVWDGSGAGDTDGIYLQRISLVNQPLGGDGGGVYNAGTLSVSQTTIDGNDAANGGGVFNVSSANAEITSSTVSNNSAQGSAGPSTFNASGNEFRVNTSTANTQQIPRFDVNAAGQSVVVWSSTAGGPDRDVYAQIYDSNGVAVGSNFAVNAGVTLERTLADVAVAANGDFAVIYQGFNGDSNQWGIRGKVFNSLGGVIHSDFVVNANANQTGHQINARIKSLNGGGYITTWIDGNSRTVWAQFLNADGSFRGSPFQVSTSLVPTDYTIYNEDLSLWQTPDGTLIEAYRGQGVSDNEIFGQRFNTSGVLLASEFSISGGLTGNDVVPSITGDSFGFVAAWHNSVSGVQIRAFNLLGSALGSATQVAATDYSNAEVSLLSTGEVFVTWDNYVGGWVGSGNVSTQNIKGRLYSRAGVALGSEFTINSSGGGTRSNPAASRMIGQRLLTLWDGNGPGDTNGIVGQYFDLGQSIVEGDGGGIFNAGTITSMANVTVSGNSAANQGGGLYNTATGTANILNTTFTLNAATGLNSNDGFLKPSTNSFMVNQNTAGEQNGLNLTANATGRAVATWTTRTSQQDQDVFARVLDNLSITPAQNEFQVNPSSVDERLNSDIAVDGSGRFLVGYQGWGLGNGWGVNARAYSSNLVPGNPFSILTTAGYSSGNPRVGTNAAGRFVIEWTDDNRDGSGSGVYARVFSADGTPLGFDIPVNQYTAGNQSSSDIFVLDDNSFFAVWTGDGSGDSAGVYGRVFDSSGTPLGNEFLINTNTTGYRDIGSIASVGNGYIVIWRSLDLGQINAQLLDSQGNKIGGEIEIGQFTPGDVYTGVGVASLPNNGFVVTWSGYNAGTNSDDVFAREYDRSGNPVSAAYFVDTNPAGLQDYTRVVTDGNGNALFAWAGQGAGDGDGIFARRYAFQLVDAPGIYNAAGGAVVLKNTVVAGESSTHGGPGVSGTFVSTGGNLIGNVGVASGFTQPSDQVGTSTTPLDPKLGPLADNGGPTKTHLPAADSPAIDAGVAAGAPATDQRGVARPKDGDNNGSAQVDIGAVERFYGSIRGRKFQDQNQNGIQEVGELGLAGWTIFLDTNNNGVLDAGERSTTTAANGDYSFQQLAPGSYTVAEVNQTGWTRTYTSTQFLQQYLDVNSGTLGLDGASSIAATADGKFLYVAGASEAKIQRFSRDLTSGLLTPLGTTTTTELVNGTNILQDVVKLFVAPMATSSGLYLYALTPNGALGVFSVNPLTGDLTLADVVRNGDTNRGTTVARLVGATGLAVSPDGLRVYVSNFSANALNGGSLLIFERVVGQTPELRLRRILSNGNAGAAPYGAGGRGVAAYGNQVYVVGETADSSDTLATFTTAASPAYLNYVSVLRNGQNDSLGHLVSGLDGANDIAISADGKFAYVSAGTSGAVTILARDVAGLLTFVESLTEGGTDALGQEIHGVQAASSVTISADGSRVYVTGQKYFSEYDVSLGAVAVFSRNATTGRLSFIETLVDTIPDVFGNPVENLEYVVDGYATTSQLYTIAGVDEDALTVFQRDTAGRDSVTLLVGDDRTGLNFSSYAAPAEIRGTVYNDLNNNGQRDVDEYGLGGIAVYLDLNSNNSYQEGEPTVATDPIGNYRFESLTAPQSYTVRLNLPSNSTVTAPSAAQDREWALSLAPNQIYVGADFNVYTQLAGNENNNQISGHVWQDTNKNGIKDASEPYLAGKQVYLDVNDNGVYNVGVDILANGLTTIDGLYSFTDLGSANFVVRVITNSGELTTTPVGNSFTKQTLTTGNNPLGLVTADFNGDTLPDLASVDGGTDKVSVRLQQVGGSFTTRSEYTVGVQPTSIAVGKFNNDSAPDIAVVQWAYSKVVFLINKNDGSGTFTRSTYEIPISSGYATIVAADIDLDGDDDLAIAVDGVADKLHILRNNAGGLSFTELQQLDLANGGPLSLAAGDLTNDGRPEFVVGNFDGDSVRVAKNNSGTSFTLQTAVTVGDGPATVAITPDLTGDGKRDVVVASIGVSTVTILAGDNAGGLTVTTPIPVGQGPRSIAVADVDKDNDLDIILGNTTTNDVVVLRKQGGTYSFPESTGLASFASLAASGVKQVLVTDINKDNVLDLVAVRGDSNSGSLAVLSNALAPGSIRLAISGSNQQVQNQNFGITTNAPAVPGDYDGNGQVQSADYSFWRAHYGDPGTGLAADGNNNNVVDAADYIIWRNALSGAAAGSGASLAEEPSAIPVASDAVLTEQVAVTSAAVSMGEPITSDLARESAFAALAREAFTPCRRAPSRRSALNEPHVAETSRQRGLLLAALAESSIACGDELSSGASHLSDDALLETPELLELAIDWEQVGT